MEFHTQRQKGDIFATLGGPDKDRGSGRLAQGQSKRPELEIRDSGARFKSKILYLRKIGLYKGF